jgi:hypothetical protein
MKHKKHWFSLAAALIWCGITGCAKDSPETIRRKLEAMVQSDLSYIRLEVKVLDSTALDDRPHYSVVEYKTLELSDEYSVKAVVEFIYLKDIKIKQVRKYRYLYRSGQWERYDKQLMHIIE